MESSRASPNTPTGTQGGSQEANIPGDPKDNDKSSRSRLHPNDESYKAGHEVVSIAPYDREAIVGQRAKFPLKILENKQVLIVTSPILAIAWEELLVTGLK